MVAGVIQALIDELMMNWHNTADTHDSGHSHRVNHVPMSFMTVSIDQPPEHPNHECCAFILPPCFSLDSGGDSLDMRLCCLYVCHVK